MTSLVALRRGVLSIVDGPFGSNLASEHYVDEGARVEFEIAPGKNGDRAKDVVKVEV